MPIRLLLLGALCAGAPARAATSPLAGSWNKDGVPYAELRADGTGQVGGERVAWRADARTLTLAYAGGEVQVMAWKIAGKTLTVAMAGRTYVYTRGVGRARAAKGAKAPPAGKDKLAKLLLSSAWCAFAYDRYSGASRSERVVFRSDGTWGSGERAESYSSGSAGSVAGQSGSSSGGRWRTDGAALFMSAGGGSLEDAGLSVSYNSNGYPILKTGGKEYSSCR